ncbi:GNAT family N-acetyltransferase [Olleya aquimaris]|uniref:RimJ/RimL family protein N-acetyltransferase n=1 Tax=Olleya aquimaris TaxID=639310 RepID=A0A327RCF5_9FLAO|nr:GNAT family N-acetyltransferase [Olleya aquimaris]RAJ14620.1 RimJ/RimL family protein N-acetyltransferase [Olleya aquimaris]
MKIITETERLYLREFIPEDAIHFYQINLDEDVIKYTGDIAFESLTEAKEFLSSYNQYQQHNMGRWAVCDKQTDDFLGWCGLKYHPKDDIVEVGYRFYKKYWNKGYATESAKAAIHYGFETLKLKTIFAHAHVNNVASHKVIEKCGLQFVDQNNYDGMPAKLYKIDNPDITIKAISGSDTIPVRHAVLRKGKPVEACPIPEDNLESTYHFGLFYKDKLVGVCTFVADQSPYFDDAVQYRLRAMGVLEEYQGYHFGKHLLNHGVAFLKTKNIDRLWFNARLIALNFYKNNGFTTIGNQFDIPKVGPHYVMHKTLQ